MFSLIWGVAGYGNYILIKLLSKINKCCIQKFNCTLVHFN